MTTRTATRPSDADLEARDKFPRRRSREVTPGGGPVEGPTKTGVPVDATRVAPPEPVDSHPRSSPATARQDPSYLGLSLSLPTPGKTLIPLGPN